MSSEEFVEYCDLKCVNFAVKNSTFHCCYGFSVRLVYWSLESPSVNKLA